MHKNKSLCTQYYAHNENVIKTLKTINIVREFIINLIVLWIHSSWLI